MTGVQTCALPISVVFASLRAMAGRAHDQRQNSSSLGSRSCFARGWIDVCAHKRMAANLLRGRRSPILPPTNVMAIGKRHDYSTGKLSDNSCR